MLRAKTAMEVAAELYTRRMFSLGNAITISIKAGSKEAPFPPLSIGINGDLMGGMRAPIEVGKRRVDIAYVNPSVIVTMAYRGKGFYKEKMALRALASFPSWDRIAFAVSKNLKVRSLYEIAERKMPLKVSTRSSGVNNSTYYAVSKILSLYGLSFAKIQRWGGKVEECPQPSSPRRGESIAAREVDAIFDEGIKRVDGWLAQALENGYEVLHLEPQIIRQLEHLGFKGAVIPKARFRKLAGDVRTVDFSGWPLITHRWLDDAIAYSVCEAIEARQKVIPVDDDRPLDMRGLCRSTDAAPVGIPFHPGATKYYKDKGYL
jgi:TRAP-type uncharacterized transport system substrate-binding protein